MFEIPSDGYIILIDFLTKGTITSTESSRTAENWNLKPVVYVVYAVSRLG